ncbi:glucokinase [Desulfurivibrio sp. D14AmB]|uniref:glucokinase n=1 Tax=Desulfurivibrio sp. D14AmB TaxID=3374370 RepID=UPI00376EE3C9
MINVFCADIGGTNSRFAHFTLTGRDLAGLELKAVRWLATAPAGSLAGQLRALYQGDFPLAPTKTDLAVLAVAGPVSEGRYSKLPLVGWEVDLAAIGREFSFAEAHLINDFTAQALTVLAPPGAAARKIIPGEAAVGGAVAVIGAGTGLGKALLRPNIDGRGTPLVVPSEGGHADFPFAGGRERDYLDFLLAKNREERISGNSVVSGSGLSSLHQFLSGEELSPAEVTRGFPRHPRTLEWAARFYGRVCRNYVLETLATGGLYIAGGVAAKAPELLTHPEFSREFHASSSMGELLAKVPVKLIMDENSGLWGAATQAWLLLRDRPGLGVGGR